jgi:cytochrome c nitrite reductase small subunit
MFKKFSTFIFAPLTKYRLVIFILLGIFFGLGFTIFRLSNAVAYMSEEPNACINCHVMTPQFSTWMHSSHRERASCNDCHVPHDNLLRKYFFKASDGMRHSFMFTFKLDPQVIRIGEAGKKVVQENCIRCHERQIADASISQITLSDHKEGRGHLCWDCHRETPHGRVHSQASTPYSIVPTLKPALPEIIDNNSKSETQIKNNK